MNKKRAKFNFCFVGVLLAIAIVLCFASFKLPASNTNYNGLFNSITATSDITNGSSAVYEITTEDASDEEINGTINRIRDILISQGFTNAGVFRMGDYIRVEIDSTNNSSNILSIIGEPKSFFISSKDQETITEDELGEYDIVGTYVKNAYTTTQVNLDTEYNGIVIEFTQEGAEKYHELSRQVAATSNSYIYFYIGGEKQSSLEIQETNNDYLSFYSSGYTKDTAQNYALQIIMSSTGINIQTITNSESTPTLGQNTLLFTMIAFVLIVIAMLVVLPVLFGDLGFVANLSILIGMVVSIFLMQALPLTTMSIAGVLGAMMGLGLMTVSHMLYLNKIKTEFYYLKRLQLAVKTGFKKSWLKILDINVIAFIGGLVLGLWNIPYVSTFGISLAIVAFVGLFNTIVMFKDFITWYVYINSKDYKRLKFTKGEGNE